MLKTPFQFAEALAAKATSGVRVKILLDAVGSSTIGEDILKILEGGPASSPGTTRSTGDASGATTTARIASR